jgi:hypothetical protein
MKRTFILTTVTVLFAALLITGCKPSRVYATKDRGSRTQPPPPPAPRYYASVSLIISPTPGFRMSQYGDGRYYHRSQDGLLYWKGYDNRFYLDKSYLTRVSYSKWEYKEWKRYSKYNGRR